MPARQERDDEDTGEDVAGALDVEHGDDAEAVGDGTGDEGADHKSEAEGRAERAEDTPTVGIGRGGLQEGLRASGGEQARDTDGDEEADTEPVHGEERGRIEDGEVNQAKEHLADADDPARHDTLA